MLTEEKVNALTKVADLIGKKTLVMWTIVTTFTTGYLYVDGRGTERRLNETRIEELKASQKELINEVKGIKQIQRSTKSQVDSTTSKLDNTIDNVNETIKSLKKIK